MKILAGSITTMASEGRLSLQVPCVAFGEHETEEVPDEWIMECKDFRMAVGREEGCYYLTPIGFEANWGKLEAAWIDQRGKGWGDYVEHAREFFDKVKSKSIKHFGSLEAKAKEGRDLLSIKGIGK